MAYQTGTVASPAALKAVIDSFCTTNGWSASGDWLSKGLSHVKLTAVGTTTLQLNGANSADGLTTPYAYTPYTYIAEADWPITYYLFTRSNPDLVVCVLHYATNLIQPIIFGDIAKVNASAFPGGNFIFAPKLDSSYQAQVNSIFYISDTNLINTSISQYSSGAAIPFAAISDVVPGRNRNVAINTGIDGVTWANTNYSGNLSAGSVLMTDDIIKAYFRSPNTWNSQAQLIPLKIGFGALSSFVMYLGYIEHLRLVRIDNYEIGDIITLGADRWKVFPWSRKDATYRNGPQGAQGSSPSTGTLGFAVYYDGP